MNRSMRILIGGLVISMIIGAGSQCFSDGPRGGGRGGGGHHGGGHHGGAHIGRGHHGGGHHHGGGRGYHGGSRGGFYIGFGSPYSYGGFGPSFGYGSSFGYGRYGYGRYGYGWGGLGYGYGSLYGYPYYPRYGGYYSAPRAVYAGPRYYQPTYDAADVYSYPAPAVRYVAPPTAARITELTPQTVLRPGMVLPDGAIVVSVGTPSSPASTTTTAPTTATPAPQPTDGETIETPLPAESDASSEEPPPEPSPSVAEPDAGTDNQ